MCFIDLAFVILKSILCKLHLLFEADLKAKCVILFTEVNERFYFVYKYVIVDGVKFFFLYEPVCISQTKLL